MKIEKSYRIAIFSIYNPPTDNIGAQVTVVFDDGTRRFTYCHTWNYKYDAADNHAYAVQAAVQNWKDHHGLDLTDQDLLQGSLSDGYVFTPLPKHLQNNEPIVPMTSNLDGGKYVKPKYLVVEKGNVVLSKHTDRKHVVHEASNDRFETEFYEIVAETPHSDGDFSYTCGSDYCRCMQ